MPTLQKKRVTPAQSDAARLGLSLLDVLMASVTDSLVMFDESGLIVLFNAGSEKLFGYAKDEALGLPFGALVPAAAIAALGGHRQFTGTRREVVARHKDNSSFPMCLSVNTGISGGTTIYVGVMNDLTDHRLDEVVRKKQNRLQVLLDGVTDAIVTVDLNVVVESFSATACTLFGYKAEEVIGHPVTMLMPSPYSEAPGEHLARLRGQDEAQPMNGGRVVIGRKQDGSAFPVEISIGEAVDGDQHLLVGFIRDITGRAGTEQRLEQLQSELLRVSRLDAMGQMTLAIAHELNQPLAAISNYVHAVKRGLSGKNLTPDIVQNANAIIDKASLQTQRAASIIKGLRGFVEKRNVRRETVDLGQVAEEALALAFVSATSKGVKVKLDLDRTLPPVMIDRVQIQQVLFNLIRNSLDAMYPCPKRELTLAAHPGPDGTVEVTVADSGPGIAPDVAGQLFKPFVTSKEGGMGVGLTICQAIIEAHGGRIWLAESSPAGTIFRFRLPLPDAARAKT